MNFQSKIASFFPIPRRLAPRSKNDQRVIRPKPEISSFLELNHDGPAPQISNLVAIFQT